MLKSTYTSILFLVFFLTCLSYSAIGQTSVLIAPSQDNTLYEDPAGMISNGMGQYIFAGRTGQGSNGTRRALLQFDLTGQIPSGVKIDSVALMLHLSNASDTLQEGVHMHRVLNSWGEGISDAPGGEGKGDTVKAMDASWIHTFYDTAMWNTAGGDFLPDTSAWLSLGADNGTYSWSDSQLVADVEFWIAHPDSNAGWILLGNESIKQTSRRFDSSDHPDTTLHPRLFVQYSDATPILPKTPLAHLSFYPNPASESCRISLDNSNMQNLQLRMLNLLGEELWTTEIAGSLSWTTSLDLSSFPDGVYIFLLEGEQGSSSFKLIKRF